MEQRTQISQSLHLSASLLQSMKLLQMNTDQLAEYLYSVAMENPTLELEGTSAPEARYQDWASKLSWLQATPGKASATLSDFETEHLGTVPSAVDSLGVFLRDQLARLRLAPPLETLCGYLTDLLDERGYLFEDDLAHLARVGVPERLLVQAVETMQALEPAGLAARSLSECFVLQLRRLPGDHSLAIAIVREHLDALAKGRFHHLSQKLGTSMEEIERARLNIQALKRNPVEEFDPPVPVAYLSPDAWVAELDGSLQVLVNQWDLPGFHLSQDYVRLLGQKPNQATEDYLREKIQQTQWLLRCISRRHKTLELCLLALADWQKDFFLERSKNLRPLFQWELSQAIGVHPSTLCRTIQNKHLQCRQGTYPISFFFSRRIGSEPDAPSEMEAKARLLELVRHENPNAPLSDERLRTDLQALGIELSRRTVSKYRSELGVLSSYVRKAK